MKELDWKIFKQIKEKAIEQFCSQALHEFEQVIKDKNQNVHSRYLLLYKLVQNTDKKMVLLFDGHSRSKAPLQLLAIRSENLADDSLLNKLSEDLLKSTDPKLHDW